MKFSTMLELQCVTSNTNVPGGNQVDGSLSVTSRNRRYTTSVQDAAAEIMKTGRSKNTPPLPFSYTFAKVYFLLQN